ncbi:uncharacterized protein LOC117648612 isoform X1 [Thrips palmi]|uniref:Uncharacterized protein LOC117648612 isoform X1 n=1 Tax=Thrips palmi TaxID=161013 RepID=A0A6P8Z954_THRPL|nr:uncharacterized protein LOC117648612 isoform X1 [Thrips palmi]
MIWRWRRGVAGRATRHGRHGQHEPLPTPPGLVSSFNLALARSATGCHQSQAQDDMSAIPHGVLAARAVSANNAKRVDPGRSELACEDPPLKYNSKLMNSIWGLYNRYSVHNFKKNTDGEFMNNNLGSHQQMLITVTAAAPLSGALLNVQ